MSNVNYLPPKSELISSPSAQTSNLGKWLAIIGTLLLAGLPIGLLLTVFSMIELFQGITLTGTGDPKVMAGGISQSLVYMVLGILTALPGFIIFSVSILVFKHKRPWVYRVSIFYAVVGLLFFPIGTIIAVIVMFKLLRNKNSYFGIE